MRKGGKREYRSGKIIANMAKNKAEYSAQDASHMRLREGVTDLRTDGRTDGRADPLTEMRGRI